MQGARVSADVAVAASAALPPIVQPFVLGSHAFLDGGVVANLPAGFIMSQGSLGAEVILCIIPKPVRNLNPFNAVDYRTLRLLNDLRESQTRHRIRKGKAVDYVGPSHTSIPVYVIAPPKELSSGLWRGFLTQRLMRKEFSSGFQLGMEFSQLLAERASGLEGFLLENVTLPSPPATTPRMGWWRRWVHVDW